MNQLQFLQMFKTIKKNKDFFIAGRPKGKLEEIKCKYSPQDVYILFPGKILSRFISENLEVCLKKDMAILRYICTLRSYKRNKASTNRRKLSLF